MDKPKTWSLKVYDEGGELLWARFYCTGPANAKQWARRYCDRFELHGVSEATRPVTCVIHCPNYDVYAVARTRTGASLRSGGSLYGGRIFWEPVHATPPLPRSPSAPRRGRASTPPPPSSR